MKLSICIATYNRGDYIAETLDSILPQLTPDVELLVVDGASPDNTPQIMAEYVARYPHIRYYREQENSGIDKDYDKAVGYANGEYCWLFTDDDLLRPGAVQRVLAALKSDVDLVMVNAEIRNKNFSGCLQERRWNSLEDKQYTKDQFAEFFRSAGDYLSFIGGVVIRRELWQARDRASYYGTLFIHFGVIFQQPLTVYAIAEPLIVIRYGNAMWTSRAFEIWMFKWPQLVWSFENFTDEDKRAVCAKEPWRDSKRRLFLRSAGAYSSVDFQKFLSTRLHGYARWKAWALAALPGGLVNTIHVARLLRKRRRQIDNHMFWYELLRSQNATHLSLWMLKMFMPKEYEAWRRNLEPRRVGMGLSH